LNREGHRDALPAHFTEAFPRLSGDLMARNTTPILIGAVVFGLLALGLTFFVLNSGGSQAPQPQPGALATPAAPGSHWVAQRTIYPRTIITRDMLIEQDNASNGAPANGIADPKDVIGHLAGRIIRAGETLTTDAVTTPIARVIPANIPIPMGLRGVAVWVDPDETAAGLVDVGDRVDVITTHELKIEKQPGQIIVGAAEFAAGRTIAQDLEVLAVDPSIQQYRPGAAPSTPGAPAAAESGAQPTPAPGATPTPTPAPTPNAANGPRRFMRVILAASPADAQRIIAANRLGQIHLTIRNPMSHERFAGGEAREYPTRVAGRATTGSTISPQDRREDKNRQATLDLFKTIVAGRNSEPLSPAIPSPAMGQTPTSGGPQPSYDKEVTVIRGTEKTRVLVSR
jgi:Flp pilus assembly protein CpaB